MASINTGDLSNFPEAEDVESPNKHLWHLLTGDSLLANEDVVHEELKRNCNKILSALTFYPRRPPLSSGCTNKTFFGLEADDEDSAVKGVNNLYGSRYAKKIMVSNKEAEKGLRERLAKALELEESIAWEIFCSYMMFEYRGKATTYSMIMSTELYVIAFLNDIRSFYMRERLCLVYCSQIILAEAVNEKHQYCDIFAAFVHSSSLTSWVKWLCASLEGAIDDDEKVAVLHTLAILLFNYSQQEGVLESFMKHYQAIRKCVKPLDIVQAEAVLYFCFFQCGDTKNSSHNSFIEQYVDKHILSLLENPYTVAAILSSLMIRFPENKSIRAKIKSIPDPEKCIPSLTELVQAYDKDSFKNKHGLSSMVLRCVYNSIDVILRLLVKDNFGTTQDWYVLLSKLLRDTDTAAEFLDGNSSDIVNLYLEALVQFPVEASPILLIWGSICEAVSETNTCTAVLAQLTEIKYIAEIFDKVDPCDMRFHSDNDRMLLERRVVAGVPVKVGTVGTLIEDTSPVIICWFLESPCTTTTVWDIIFDEIINPTLKGIKNRAHLEFTSEVEYGHLPSKQTSLILEIAEFLTTFGKASRAMPPRLFELYRPICFILSILTKESKIPSITADLVGLLLRLVDAGSKFNEALFPEFLSGIWPNRCEENLAADLVIGYESVKNCKFSLSLGLLTATLGIVKETDIRKTPISAAMKEFYTQSVLFIVENVFYSYGWVIPTEQAKNEIMTLCIQILYALFQLSGEEWNELKTHCIKAVTQKSSPLLTVLEKSEDLLQDSIIKPTLENQKLPEIIHYFLSLLLQMVKFDSTLPKKLDLVLNYSLPIKVARFVRHRLSTKIPTLAINLLGKVAQAITVPLLASFGNESDSFRDILIQRLEFKSEDIHLKIAILDFLNVCVQMQSGLIEHFLLDESLVERLMELINEEEENIQIGALGFVRALFRNGTFVIKKAKQIWAMIAEPLKRLNGSSSLKIAAMTFDIYSFEVYKSGLSDTCLHREFSEFLQKDTLQKIIKVLIESKENEDSEKCLSAFKNLLIIIFSKPDLNALLTKDAKSMLMEEMFEKFWSLVNEGDSLPEKRLTFLSTLMCHLFPSEDSEFLDDLSNRMAISLDTNIVAVDTCLFSMANCCIKAGKGEISVRTADNLVKVISGSLTKCFKMYEGSEVERVFPLLLIAASTASSLISSSRCVHLDKVTQRYYLAAALARTACLGITHEVGLHVVAECLSALIRMAMRAETCEMVQNCGLVKSIWLPMSKNPENNEEDSERWCKIYSLCIHLNTCLLSAQKFYYLEDCLNFCAILGSHLTAKLWSLPDLIDRSLLNNPEKNFGDLKDALMFDVFILNFVSTVSPYFDAWRKVQVLELNKIIEGVFVTLRTTIGLLSQPYHLMLLISKPKPQSSYEVKLTSELLEVQTKMWDVMAISVDIFCRLRTKSFDYIEVEQLHNTMYSIGQLCVKALTKGDRRSHPSINSPQRVIVTLEKCLSLLYFTIQRAFEEEDRTMDSSSGQTATKPLASRDMAAEVAVLCDNIRRLSTQKSEFLLMLCTKLETSSQ